MCELLIQLAHLVKTGQEKTMDLTPTTLVLDSMLTYYFAGKRTCTPLRTENNTEADVLNSKDTDHAMVSKDVLPLHVIIGSDYTLGFYGHGKNKLYRRYLKILRQESYWVGWVSLELQEDVKAEMKEFVFSTVNGESENATCAQSKVSK